MLQKQLEQITEDFASTIIKFFAEIQTMIKSKLKVQLMLKAMLELDFLHRKGHTAKYTKVSP